MTAALTAAQRRALRHLESVNWCTPASLGQALSDRDHLKAQGAGRIGGAMGSHLVRLGLADRHRIPWKGGALYAAGYHITPAGRTALADTPSQPAGLSSLANKTQELT